MLYNFNKFKLNEYVNNDIISLRNYLNSTETEKKEELTYTFSFLFDKFYEECQDELEDFEYDSELQGYEIVEDIKDNNKQVFDLFANWLYNELLELSREYPEDVPSWNYLDFRNIVKNQWLIHFTNKPNEIAKHGFKFGVGEIDKLGLTTFLADAHKTNGGYNFAYTLADYLRYHKTGSYGNYAVLFRASGVRCWHNGDDEYQTIFLGSTATNIIPITQGENCDFAIYSKSGNLLYESDELSELVDWFIKNEIQYRKVLYK